MVSVIGAFFLLYISGRPKKSELSRESRLALRSQMRGNRGLSLRYPLGDLFRSRSRRLGSARRDRGRIEFPIARGLRHSGEGFRQQKRIECFAPHRQPELTASRAMGLAGVVRFANQGFVHKIIMIARLPPATRKFSVSCIPGIHSRNLSVTRHSNMKGPDHGKESTSEKTHVRLHGSTPSAVGE